MSSFNNDSWNGLSIHYFFTSFVVLIGDRVLNRLIAENVQIDAFEQFCFPSDSMTHQRRCLTVFLQ